MSGRLVRLAKALMVGAVRKKADGHDRRKRLTI
jgi:hypothetical protein